MQLRIASYNIRFGGRGREGHLAEVLQGVNPDVTILQEAKNPRVVAWLAGRLGAWSWGSRTGLSLAFISRVGVRQWRWHGSRSLKHPILEIRLKDPLPDLYGIHLRPRFSRWSERARVREVKALLHGIIDGRQEQGPHLLMGDFNAVAPNEEVLVARMPLWIRTLIRLSGGRIGSEAISTLLDAGYVDGYRCIHGEGPGYTFPSIRPHVRLDYAFFSPDLAPRLWDCRIVSDPQAAKSASDHLPLLAVLEFEATD